jgi:cyclo(L-tyrosyl-L-tyrosyl) synthase
MLTRSRPAESHAEPVGEHSRRVWTRRHHILIAMSPANSYFSPGRICQLVSWAARHCREEQFHLITWAEPYARWSLRALGYQPEAAAAKARKAERILLNRARDALDAMGISEPDQHLANWRTLAPSARYIRLRREVDLAYATNERFRQAVQASAAHYLRAHRHDWRGTLPWWDRVTLAAEYVRAELPLYLDTPAILGVADSLYVYHQVEALHSGLFQGEFDETSPGAGAGLRPAPNQGLVILANPEPPVDQPADTDATAAGARGWPR